MPIPRPTLHVHRPGNRSGHNTPLSHSPSSSESSIPFSPLTNTNSLVSPSTNVTTPPSSYSYHNSELTVAQGVPRTLTYPSVPPPSLSSSFGSPTISYHVHSPIESLSRRNSGVWRSSEWRVTGRSGEGSRRNSIERGARVAETGTLVPRSRAGSQALPPTTEAPDPFESKDEGSKVVNGVHSR